MVGRKHLAILLVTFLGLTAAVAAPVAAADISGPGHSRALELKAPTPDWYTTDLHQKVLAAGERGEHVRLPRAAAADIDSALLFTGIRPGSWMIFPAWCTLNFVFGDAARPYIGTAGHCTEVGEEVTIVAAPGVLMNIGRTAVSVDNGVGDDFALIEIRPEMTEYVNPSMAIVAGPTASGAPAMGDPVLHVGHGLAVGTGGTPRAGVTTWIGEGPESGGYGWTGVANLGDSGSAVRSASGQAVGNLTHLIVGIPYLPANVAGTSLDRILQIAGASLATASLVPDPLP